MRIRQREIWLADLREPLGAEAGYRRPVIIVQADGINASRLTTYLTIPITGSGHLAPVPWNLAFPATTSGLQKNSIAQTNLLLTVNENELVEHLGEITTGQLEKLFRSLDIALGRANL